MEAQVLNSTLGMSPDQSRASLHSTAEIKSSPTVMGGGQEGTCCNRPRTVFLGICKTIDPLDYRTWLANFGATLLS